MATAIRAIPTLYGETAKTFESEATLTEQNPGTEDYRHEAQVVADFLKTCPHGMSFSYCRCVEPSRYAPLLREERLPLSYC